MAAKKAGKLRFGDWQTIHELGSGGFNIAHKEHLPSGKFGVIKFLKLDPEKADPQEYSLHLKTFISELKTLKEFDSPYINKLYDWDFQGEKPWMVIQFFNGTTLKEEVQQNGVIG